MVFGGREMVGLKDEIFVKFGQGGLVHPTLKSAFFVFLAIFFSLLAPLWLYSPYFADPFITLFSPESEKCHFGTLPDMRLIGHKGHVGAQARPLEPA